MEHIDEFNYYFNDKSAILNTAKEIKKLKINKKFSLFLPMFILNLFDIISVKKIFQLIHITSIFHIIKNIIKFLDI